MAHTAYQINESKNRQLSLAVTVGVHAVVFFLLYYFVTWYPPDPPLPDYGVELNFGIDPEGYGNVQTTAPANDAPANQDAAPGLPEQQTPQEPQPEAQPVVTPQPDIKQDETASDLTSDEESPVEAAPPKKRVKETPKPVVVEKPAPPKPSLPSAPAYTPTKAENGGGGTNGTGSDKAANNNGDRPGKVGDQGDRRGTLDGKALYGNPGNGNGASLDMSGWTWDNKPDKVDPFAEEGRIVFEIKVDESGEIVEVKPVDKTVSPKVVQFYQAQIENLSFSKTRENVSSAPISKGRITILIRSK